MENKKVRINFRMSKETDELIKKHYLTDNCKSRNEFIVKALNFYINHLILENYQEYFNREVFRVVKDTANEKDKVIHESMMDFIFDLATAMNLVYKTNHIDEDEVRILRGKCMGEVRKQTGKYDF